MKELLLWNDEYTVGIVHMDDDHIMLVNLINKIIILRNTENNTAKQKKEVVADLLYFTKNHFRNEEEMLERNNFPYIDSHKLEHRLFEAKVQKYINLLDTPDDIDLGSIAQLTYDWLINHILKRDKEYTKYIKDKRII